MNAAKKTQRQIDDAYLWNTLGEPDTLLTRKIIYQRMMRRRK